MPWNHCIFFLTCKFIVKGYLKALEDKPEATIFLGDSAYHRSNVKGVMGIGRPVPLPKDGSQPKVNNNHLFIPISEYLTFQGVDVAASHVVQSTRAVVEQTFADLKTAKVMEGNKISTVAEKERELDCVIGLHNLRVLLKKDPDFQVPANRRTIPNNHIFFPLTPFHEVDLKIPPPITPSVERNIKHIRKFIDFLPSLAPAIKRAIEKRGDEGVFFPTVASRGRNLYNGAYVLQLRLQEEIGDVWTVKFIVGASYSYEVHTGYFQMSHDNAAVAQICDCYSG